jgi:hypothetical protein
MKVTTIKIEGTLLSELEAANPEEQSLLREWDEASLARAPKRIDEALSCYLND